MWLRFGSQTGSVYSNRSPRACCRVPYAEVCHPLGFIAALLVKFLSQDDLYITRQTVKAMRRSGSYVCAVTRIVSGDFRQFENRQASGRSWDRSAMPTATPCARTHAPCSNARCSTAESSEPKLRHAWSSSGSSKAGTIQVADTRLGDISRPSMTKEASSMG